ncbi:MAG: dipeptide/oligopeptide/nickel ABC transporter ATP-binding protein [Candidatus Omnitrophota bacterium]
MIELIKVTKYFNDVKALDSVSLKIDYGESVGIVGRSGCGKTTLAKIVARLIKPTEGKVLYRGEDIFKLKRSTLKKFRQKVQIVFQDPFASLNPKMRIKDILSEPLIIHKKATRKKMPQKVKELLKKVELKPDILDKYPHQLSGGERQRVNIARALSVEPKLLICDEPLSSLDLPIQARILKLLSKLKKEENLALLFISHDPAVIKLISDRVIKL